MKYTFDVDYEEDNTIIYHYLDGKSIDAKSFINMDDINAFIEFKEEFGYLPNRKEHPTHTGCSLDRKRIEEIRQFKNQSKL